MSKRTLLDSIDVPCRRGAGGALAWARGHYYEYGTFVLIRSSYAIRKHIYVDCELGRTQDVRNAWSRKRFLEISLCVQLCAAILINSISLYIY
jgi:hypothetical protein